MSAWHGGCTSLSSRTPRARQKNILFLICITKMGQHFINVFPWVYMHNLLHRKSVNQIWWSGFLIKHTVSN